MAKFRTHYDNLKVTRHAHVSAIKTAYKALCQVYHPDKYEGGIEKSLRIIKLINKAYIVLSDPIKRIEHDNWIDKKELELELASTSSTRELPNKDRLGDKSTGGTSWENIHSHRDGSHTNNTGYSDLSHNIDNTKNKNKNNTWIA
jgi:DnaJ-class molecular chaperone